MTTRLHEATHPRDADLVRYMDGEGGPDQLDRARAHLGECMVCQQRLDLLRARSAAFSELIDGVAVPEREIAAPPMARAVAASADPRVADSGWRSADLLKAAVIVLLIAVPAAAMVPPVRDWVVTQWTELTASRAAPDESTAPITTSGRSAVSFVPSDGVMNVWLARAPAPEAIRIVPTETGRVTIETIGPAGDRMLVLPDGVRIENVAGSNTRYVITVPSALDAVVVHVAGVQYMSLDPRDPPGDPWTVPHAQPQP